MPEPLRSDMNHIEQFLIGQDYSFNEGFFSRTALIHNQTDADKVWSIAAQASPIAAAAATSRLDPFSKYPTALENEIANDDHLVLDAGCGYGRVAIPLLKEKIKIRLVGLDASQVMLRYFIHLLNQHGLTNLIGHRLLLAHSTMPQAPFYENAFDYIYSCAVLLHNPYRTVENIIKEFHKFLSPNGKLILMGSFPNIYNLEAIQNFLYCKFIDEPNRNGPVRVYSRHRVLKLFDNWSSVKISPCGVSVFPRQVAKIPVPFGKNIRKLNAWVERKNFRFISRASLLLKFFDVVAVK